MDKLIKSQWLQALRSGKYEQCKGSLKDKGAYCCLGVLCDLHARAFGGGWDSRNKYLDCSKILPIEVALWAKLKQNDPIVSGRCLSWHNDGDDMQPAKTFPEIADLIEQHL